MKGKFESRVFSLAPISTASSRRRLARHLPIGARWCTVAANGLLCPHPVILRRQTGMLLEEGAEG